MNPLFAPEPKASSAILAVGVSVSLLLHGAVPWIELPSVQKAENRAEIELVTLPPETVEELVTALDETSNEDEGDGSEPEAAPEAEPEPEAPELPAPEPEAAPEPETEAPELPAPEPEAAPETDPEAAPEAEADPEAETEADPEPALPEPMLPLPSEPVAPPPSPVAKALDLKQALKEELLREKRRRQRAALRRKKAAAKKRAAAQRRARARREARKKQGAPKPPAILREGDPEAVWVCNAEDRGFRAEVRAERALREWVTMVPTVLFAFPTNPGLGSYVDGMTLVAKRNRRYTPRLGRAEFALPATPIEMDLELPLGVTATLGRDDARCLVGFNFVNNELFPLVLTRVPLTLTDTEGHQEVALVDIAFEKDGSFKLATHLPPEPKKKSKKKRRHKTRAERLAEKKAREAAKDAPPKWLAHFDNDEDTIVLKEGRLKNAKLIEDTIVAHYEAAKAVKGVADNFGIDLRRIDRARRQGNDVAAVGEAINQIGQNLFGAFTGKKPKPSKKKPKPRKLSRKTSRRR